VGFPFRELKGERRKMIKKTIKKEKALVANKRQLVTRLSRKWYQPIA
jgi:hypothetical protein